MYCKLQVIQQKQGYGKYLYGNLGTRSRLPDGQREVALVVELPGDHIVGRIRYRRTQLGVQSEFLVGLGGRLLQNAHGLDYLALISVNMSGVIWA